MKTNLLSSATFFVLLLVAVLVAAAGVAAGWRPFQEGTPELRAVVENHRFAVPLALLGVPFGDVRELLVSRVDRKLRFNSRLRRDHPARVLKGARQIFRDEFFDDEFALAYDRLRFKSRLADFKDLHGYLSITVHNRGGDAITGVFLRVPGARFARILPVAAGADSATGKDAAGLIGRDGLFAARAQGVNRGLGRGHDANGDRDPATGPAPRPGLRIAAAGAAAVEDVEEARIPLGRLAGGTSLRVDVWLRQYDEGWDWTKRIVLGHDGGRGIVTFHGAVSPLFERFDRNPLVALAAASALLLIAGAIVILWFAGLFMRSRARAKPPAA